MANSSYVYEFLFLILDQLRRAAPSEERPQASYKLFGVVRLYQVDHLRRGRTHLCGAPLAQERRASVPADERF